jgi:tRNA(Ile)-lysidine synthase
MDGSRRSAPADRQGSRRPLPAAPAVAAVDAVLATHVASGATVAVALSGGRDSIALLDACIALRDARAISVVAIHVHHGLSPSADAWAAFCEAHGRSVGVPVQVRRVAVGARPREGVEAAARELRYSALADAARDAGASAILLAHHEDDQAETLLLQLFRGAGPRGLAAMPAAQSESGILWLRPLLGISRNDIDAHVAARGLPFVDDPSNDDARHRRNLIRSQLAPLIARAFPGYPGTLGRAARLQAEAALLLDELAAVDAADAMAGPRLARARLAALPERRARNLLRAFLRANGLRAPGAGRLAEMLRQFVNAAPDRQVRIGHDGRILGVHRGFVVLHEPEIATFEVPWRGEPTIALPHGQMTFEPCDGDGLALDRIGNANVVLRPRTGGERLRLVPAGPSRSVKHLLQEAAVPPWARSRLPLVYCDGILVAVPGIGIDEAWRAGPGRQGVLPTWQEATTTAQSGPG